MKLAKKFIMSHNFDYLVIGSGIAGLNFALHASKNGRVAIITKDKIAESNSKLAQGGIAVVWDKEDNFKKHVADTLKAGCYLNDKKAVTTLVKEGPQRIKDLINLGVNFDKIGSNYSLTQEGAHSARRIVHVKDNTGKAVEKTLLSLARKNKNIKFFENEQAIDLIIKNKKCLGLSSLNVKNNKINIFEGHTTVLATGGAGQVYSRNCNSPIATGDGIAIAQRAGAKIKDLEFIQFHPTALNKKNAPTFLLSESLRGEGAILINKKGEAFMKKYHKLKDLAPRDIVARAVFQELKYGPVFLDIRHRGKKYLTQRFPYIYKNLLKYNLKLEKNLVPISPAAHYTCGGVQTDLNGKTSIKNLYAIGEVACTGVHGANRLASNSLLECLVFSYRAAESTTHFMKKYSIFYIPYSSRNTYHVTRNKKMMTSKIKKHIQNLMWHNVGIIRQEKKLKKTLQTLNKYDTNIKKILKNGINKEALELQNLCQVAILITEASLKRKKSVGAHYLI